MWGEGGVCAALGATGRISREPAMARGCPISKVLLAGHLQTEQRGTVSPPAGVLSPLPCAAPPIHPTPPTLPPAVCSNSCSLITLRIG